MAQSKAQYLVTLARQLWHAGARQSARATGTSHGRHVVSISTRGPLLSDSVQEQSCRFSSTPAWREAASALGPRLASAASLHLSAAWQAHRPKVYAVAAGLSVVMLWRASCWLSSTSALMSRNLAEWGLLSLAVSLVLLGAQYLRWRSAIHPAAVYRAAMIRLHASPAVLEVLGPPLRGSPLTASIITGGGVYRTPGSGFWPQLRSQRIQMLFPLQGSQRPGLVCLEARRRAGAYAFKLLAVDVAPQGSTSWALAAAAAQPQEGTRVYVQGSAAEYRRGEVLVALREPFLRAVSSQAAMDAEEEAEVAAEEASKALQASKQTAGQLPGSSRSGGSVLSTWLDSLASGWATKAGPDSASSPTHSKAVTTSG
ncbi:hypothetical protein V8C86DRAFT_2479527 [Haematococcus lacustris]